MSKEEIALELVKMSYEKYLKEKILSAGGKANVEKIVTDLYNYIYEAVNFSVSMEEKSFW